MDGILEQIKNISSYYYTGTITKKGMYEALMDVNKRFYEEYPYALKWDYENFIRKMLDYYEGTSNGVSRTLDK